MKAYIVKMSFESIEPMIWRKVILPAGATFNRLHETIQRVTNFQSFFIDEPYHFFDIKVDGLLVTNNPMMHEEYGKSTFHGLKLKRPSHLKIDSILEGNRELLYRYDSGDDWGIRVELEEIVDDYYFGYPTLLEGEGTAPPEDVGGPPGYEQFLLAYHDTTHPEHGHMREWAESQHYRAYDPEFINDILKYTKYQKTEWDKINHINYEVLSDKYRCEKNTKAVMVPNEQLLLDYIVACTNLYGVVPMKKVVDIYNEHNEEAILLESVKKFVRSKTIQQQLVERFSCVYTEAFVAESVSEVAEKEELERAAAGKPYYVPDKKELLRFVDDVYVQQTPAQEQLKKLLREDYGDTINVDEEVKELVLNLQLSGGAFTNTLSDFLEILELPIEKAQRYIGVVIEIANTTRLWENRGHTPHELLPYDNEQMNSLPSNAEVKIGRNDPCSCGSGKKYKKCCGR